MPESIKKHVQQLDTRLHTLEHRSDINFLSIDEQLEEILQFQERAKQNFNEVERRLEMLNEMGVKIDRSSFSAEPEMLKDFERKLEGKLQSLEDVVMLMEVELVKAKETAGSLVPAEGMPSVEEDRMRVLEHKIATIEKSKLGAPAELVQHEPRLATIEENILGLEGKMKQETERLERMVEGRVITEDTAKGFIHEVKQDMEMLREEMERAKLLKQEIFAREKSLASKDEFQQFEAFVQNEISKMKNIIDRITALEKSLDTKLVDIEERLSEEIRGHRAGFDTRLVDMEERILKMARDEFMDVQDAVKRATQIEKHLDARAAAVVTKELGEFAEIVDKKFPHMVSRTDFDAFTRHQTERVKRIEVPDMSRMESRLDTLEMRLGDLTDLIRAVTGRMPMVVE